MKNLTRKAARKQSAERRLSIVYRVRIRRTVGMPPEIVASALRRRDARGIARDWVISGAYEVEVERTVRLLGREHRVTVSAYRDPFAGDFSPA